MARFSKLEKAMGVLIGLDLARPGTTRKLATAAVNTLAGPRGPLGARATVGVPAAIGRVGMGAASLAGRAAAANPITAGALLGGGFLQSDPGQALLELAAERGAADRIALEQAIDERIFAATRVAESPTFRGQVKSAARRKVSKYSKAVKAGMAAAKKSKFGGKAGKITNAKKTFATVNKVASAVNKGRKVSTKGITGVIGRAVRKIL